MNSQAVVLADRAIGDGNDPASRSSVWTDAGSGEWRGTVARNDGSASFDPAPGGGGMGLRYGELVFEGGDVDNLFSKSFDLVPGVAGTPDVRIAADSGVLYDEADSGTDPDAF